MISVSICSPNTDLATPWADLALRAQPNVFMHPVALKAAVATGFADIHLLLAWDQSTSPHRLVGLWALQEKKVAPFWPTLLDALPYNYAFLSNPVIDPAYAAQVIPAFIAAINNDVALPNVVHLHAFDADSPNYALMQRELTARGSAHRTFTNVNRPFATREAGLKKTGSTRKKLRQDWNRLSALGEVDVVNARAASSVTQAFEIFLALELASWKGARGTALLCDAKDAVFVRRLMVDLSAEGNASVALLRVDGKAIAAQVLMYCGATAYTWKTAYDAGYARYSPGMLLVDKITEQLLALPEIEAIDSCSSDDGFMAQLWVGRRTMVDVLIDVGAGMSPSFALEAGRQFGYHRLRNWRDRWRARASASEANKPALVTSSR